MILDFCCICGKKEDLHHHHIIPVVETDERRNIYDDETKFITLCYEHHNWIHSKDYKKNINHSRLTKLGLDKARKKGINLGRKRIADDEMIERIRELREIQGLSIREIADKLSVNRGVVQREGQKHKISRGTVHNILKGNYGK